VSREEILALLKTFKGECAEKYGITSLGLFGSAVRGENRPDSDVDVVVKLKKQDMFHLIGIKQDLEETLRASVDVISYRDTMNPFLKNRIDRESLYV